jgi:carboxypeptidase Taq
MTAFHELMSHARETAALEAVAGRTSWDQETVMPRGAAAQRAEEMAALEAVLHARRTDPRVGDLLNAAEGLPEAQTEVGRAQLRLIRRDHERACRVPARLASALAKAVSLGQGIWAQARADEDVAAFLPVLDELLALSREKGAALAGGGGGGDAYDALLQDYEPGATAAGLDAMFGALRPSLVALRDRIRGAAKHPPALEGSFPEAAQLALSREIAGAFGYDFNRGRIDKAVHPFSSGSGADVRITTRTSPDDPFNCLYSTIHEVGHAAYEQAVEPAFALSPLGRGVSMGVHESQSRIYENQLGRSRAFTGWLHGRMTAAFGHFFPEDPEAFFATVNRVTDGYIRTESDEVQYNLHILLRFDLERALLSGDLATADLEAAWNDRFKADFGVEVRRPSDGCLQDVHWSVGFFGYFPTYSLGNVYAGCLAAALRRDVPDLDTALAGGDTSAATDWLRERLQRHGGLRPPRETIEHACGFTPTEGPLLAYLEEKFGQIYGL